MQFDIFTLLPEIFPPYLESSILNRARQKGLIDVRVHNIRDYTHDKHHTTDDTPYGGGGGMVMKPEPVFEAVETILGLAPRAPLSDPAPESNIPIILLTPQGRVFNQRVAEELSRYEQIVLICGRYEGVDERVAESIVTDELSIGDYVLTGGELPALVVVDALVRLVPGVVGDAESVVADSFVRGLLDYPHYTRPAVFRGQAVPDVLLSGHHGEIEKWRRRERVRRTLERRPDLIADAVLDADEQREIERWRADRDRKETTE